MTIVLMDVFGWLGAALLLMSYYFVSTGKVHTESKQYQIANIVGSVLLIVNSFYYGALPSVFVNFVWIFIGLVTMMKITKNKEQKNDSV